MKRIQKRLIEACILIGLIGLPAFADDKDSPPPAIEPKAEQTFKRMSDYLAAVQSFSFKAGDLVDQSLKSGHRVQLSALRTILIRRPNRLYADYTGDGIHRRTWYDGKTLVLLDMLTNEYGRIDVPATIDETLDFAAEKFQITLPLADLMFSSPYAAVRDHIDSGRYVGVHDVNGVACHHLTFKSGPIDWQIWIDTGDRPLPRKLVITYGNVPGVPQYVAFLSDWNLSADAPDSAFTFVPPAGAKEVEFKPLVARTHADED